MPDKTHPVYHQPRLHCGKCQGPLVFPRHKRADEADIRAGKAVLAECATCSVGLMVPAELFKHSDHTPVKVVTVTHAMRMQRPPK